MLLSRKRILLPVICLCLICSVLTGCQSREAAAAEKLIEALDIETPDGDAVRAAREACDALSEEERQHLENYIRLTEAETRYQAYTVDALIDAVGEITPDSGPSIRAARDAYDALDDAARGYVEHAAALTAAEEEFRRLSDEAAAARIDELINAIGEVTTEKRDAVEEARADYEELDAQARALVGALPILEAAEDRLVLLNDLEEAEKMDAAIAALGEITLESEADVNELRKRYDALPDGIRSQITSAGELDDAETAIRNLKDDAAAAEIKKLSDDGQYDEAIAYAEDYMQGRPISGLKSEIVKNCLKSYAAKANALMKDSRYEEAYELLSGCRKTYAEADLSDVNKSWKSLEKAIAEPRNGQVFSSSARGGYSTLTVETSDSPAFIKVISTKDAGSLVSFYVRANSSVTINVKNGTYSIRFATGERWFGSDILFGSSTQYITLDNDYRFSVRKEDGVCFASDLTLTLVPVRGGRGTYSEIPAEGF